MLEFFAGILYIREGEQTNKHESETETVFGGHHSSVTAVSYWLCLFFNFQFLCLVFVFAVFVLFYSFLVFWFFVFVFGFYFLVFWRHFLVRHTAAGPSGALKG